MRDDFYDRERQLEQGLTGAGLTLGRYTAKTFLTLALGLLLTFAVAYLGYATLLVPYAMYTISGFHLIVLVAELAVVIGMTAMIHKISAGVAAVFFFLYAFLTGVTFSTYFLIFSMPSLILVFAASALYFAAMALIGYFTRIDLSRMRNLLFSGLLFLIVANVLLLFIPSLQLVDRVSCSIGVIIFLGYTAYDTQRIGAFYQAYLGDEAMLKKASIFSALQLYLDFVNLFLYILRLFGKKKR